MVQTENSFFRCKAKLRLNNLPQKNNIKVLDCFSADGSLWNYIQDKTDKQLIITRIELKKNKRGIYLQGDNLKYLSSLDLDDYDIIDLDSFGCPAKQLELIFSKKTKQKYFFVTFIQTMQGKLPNYLLLKLGYSKEMIKKCPSLFNRHGLDKFLNYLFTFGIKNVKIMCSCRKNYLFFEG